jgi:hypothetical protein
MNAISVIHTKVGEKWGGIEVAICIYKQTQNLYSTTEIK